MASRARLRTRSDFEYAILWENVRAEYFTSTGDHQRADQCKKSLHELKWRLAMLPSTEQQEPGFGDPLANAGWVPSKEVPQFR